MKKVIVGMLLVLLALTGCQQVELPDEPEAKIKKVKVTVLARATQADALQYPLVVLAFDTQGRCAAQQTIASAEELLKLSLAKGEYRIVVLSGQTAYKLPQGEPTLTTPIAMPDEDNVATTALMRGEAMVQVGTKSTRVSLTMHYEVASVQLLLTGVPSDVVGVSARFEEQYSQVNYQGEKSQPRASVVRLKKNDDGTWIAPVTYMLDGVKTQTKVTLALSSAAETKYYATRIGQPLKAATPYHLNGQYVGDAAEGEMLLTGDILAADWLPVVEAPFVFGSHGGTDVPDSPVDETTPSLTDAPKAGSLWQGKHVVALVMPAGEREADIVLLSKQNWDAMPSALNANEPSAAKEAAAYYQEEGLMGWSIPTTVEAQALAQHYAGAGIHSLNDLFVKVGGSPVFLQYEGKKVRYLCNDALSTFSFRDSKLLAAGATVKTYHLRLVKRLRVKW